MTTRRIPVVVLAGFLGSGKTTLLNHLLRRSRGTRIGAVVNDFGSIEIDAMTVAGQVDSMVSLGDGCLCCAVDTSDLDEVLDRLARPELRMDVVVVEASGLAEPETLIRMILASGSEHIVYGGLVEVVDGVEFEETRARHPELDRHVRAADLVVLNKADLTPRERRLHLEETLRDLAPGTPVVAAAHGRVDPELLFDPPRRERPAVEQLSFDTLLYDEDESEAEEGAEGAGRDGTASDGHPDEGHDACGEGACGHARHLHSAYRSVEFTTGRPMDSRRLLAFLDSRPSGLYRVKGFVDFGAADPERTYTVHAVGGFLRFTPAKRRRDEERGTQLVMIGAGVDAEALLGDLASCVAGEEAGAADADPTAMWGVWRYVDEPAAEAEDGKTEEVPLDEERFDDGRYDTAGTAGG